MDDLFLARFDAKLKVIQAHAKSLNVFLEMELVAHEGRQSLKDGISYINIRLPECHKRAAATSPAQSFLISQTFVSLISEFESYIVDTMVTVIRRHPQKLGSETFRLSEILETKDPDELIRIAAERFINGVMYKRANEYRKALADVLSADESFLVDKWPSYVECKARRDIGVHNSWQVNDTYRRKLQEVGLKAPESEYLPPSNEYFWESLNTISNLINEIAQHCVEKFG